MKESGIKIDIQIETDVKNLKRTYGPQLIEETTIINIEHCIKAVFAENVQFSGCTDSLATEFFEDTIAEEQYEAKKLDIMRDALRSKATYNLETKRMEEDMKMSPEPPTSPVTSVSPEPQSGDGSDSHVGNGNVPVTQNGDVPVTQNGDVPVTQNGDVPVTQNGDVPVTQNGDVPVTQKGTVPVSAD